MQGDKGFTPMPLSIKIIFLLQLLGLLGIVQSLGNLGTVPYVPLLGIKLSGIVRVLPFALSFLLSVIFLFSLWNRNSWAWKFGIAFLIFGTINSLLSLPYLPEISSFVYQASLKNNPELQEMPENLKEVMVKFSQDLAVGMVLISCIMNLIFIVFIYKNRHYFDSHARQ